MQYLQRELRQLRTISLGICAVPAAIPPDLREGLPLSVHETLHYRLKRACRIRSDFGWRIDAKCFMSDRVVHITRKFVPDGGLGLTRLVESWL